MALGLLTGCYSLQPVRGPVPEVGTEVAFDVTDRGRVALGGTMGPEIARVEGTLLENQNGNFLVAVRAVQLLRGGYQVWSGEEVRLQEEYLGTAYERRLSLGRSIALGAIGIGGFAAFFVTRALVTSGTSSPGGDGDPGDVRIGRP